MSKYRTPNNIEGLAAQNELSGENEYLQSTNHALNVSVTSTAVPTLLYTGQTSVTTAGTRVALAASQAVKSVVIKAETTNTGVIYVGNSTVTSSNGFILSAGDTVSIDIADLSTVSIDSSVNGEGVSYLGSN